MHRLMIIDDEPLIVDGVCESIREHYGNELEVYKTYSVLEALEIMKKDKLDIVIVDINMPGMTGIEFLELTRNEWPGCKVILYTGYNDFDYIQNAVRKDVIDYILKSEDDERIFGAIDKALDMLNTEVEKYELLKSVREQVEQAIPVIQKDYLASYLEGYTCNIEERREQFEKLSISLNASWPVLLTLVRLDRMSSNIGFTEKTEIFYSMGDLVKHNISAYTNFIPIISYNNMYVLLIQPKEKGDSIDVWGKTISAVHSSLDIIQKTFYTNLEIQASFIACNNPVSWDAVGDKFDHLMILFEKTNGLSSEIIITDNYIQNYDSDDFDRYKEIVRQQIKKTELLRKYLETGNEGNFLSILKEIMACIVENSEMPGHLVLEVFYTISVIFLAYINRQNSASAISTDYKFEIENLTVIDKFGSPEEIFEYFMKLAQILFDLKKKQYTDINERIIDKINSYIKLNLDSDITLAKLSNIAHFNPSYLSRIYKQITGKNVTDYINEVRLEYAIEKLNNDKCKIGEISKKLGFANSSYFTRFFRKQMNISPQEYRDMTNNS